MLLIAFVPRSVIHTVRHASSVLAPGSSTVARSRSTCRHSSASASAGLAPVSATLEAPSGVLDRLRRRRVLRQPTIREFLKRDRRDVPLAESHTAVLAARQPLSWPPPSGTPSSRGAPDEQVGARHRCRLRGLRTNVALRRGPRRDDRAPAPRWGRPRMRRHDDEGTTNSTRPSCRWSGDAGTWCDRRERRDGGAGARPCRGQSAGPCTLAASGDGATSRRPASAARGAAPWRG
jgi:hypothetical protein